MVYAIIFSSFVPTKNQSPVMKKTIILMVLAEFLLVSISDAQIWRMRRYEAMAGIGTANHFGDIGGFTKGENLLGIKDYRFLKTRPSFYLGVRYKIRERIAAKVNFTYGFFSGDDKRGTNVNRDYAFTTNIFEVSVQGEYAFWREQLSHSYLMMKGRGITDFVSNFSAYAFAGIGSAIFNPHQNDKLIARAGEINTSSAIVFPVGVALKYGLSPRTSLCLEIGGRLTTSDKIDGYPSDYSRSTDVYYFGVVSYIYKVKTSRKGWPVFRE